MEGTTRFVIREMPAGACTYARLHLMKLNVSVLVQGRLTLLLDQKCIARKVERAQLFRPRAYICIGGDGKILGTDGGDSMRL